MCHPLRPVEGQPYQPTQRAAASPHLSHRGQTIHEWTWVFLNENGMCCYEATFRCAHLCKVVHTHQGGQACAGAARAQAARPAGPGTLCGQPADDPRRAVPRLCVLRVLKFKPSFTQLGASWHATLRVNGLCVAVFTGRGPHAQLCRAPAGGVALPVCAEVAGFLGVPRTRDGPKTCASCPGPEARGCVGVAGGRLVTSSGCRRAQRPLHTWE